MIISKFDDLRRQKALREHRDISAAVVARETGIPPNAVGKIKDGKITRIYLSTLDTLCEYFEVDSIADLLEYRKSPVT